LELLKKNKISFPLIIKYTRQKFILIFRGTQGKGVMKIDDEETLVSVLDLLKGTPLIIQEFIKSSSGRDIRIFIIGNEIIGS
jgi:glutathione synthase/RimK-type ligase-like ATP-grasp enzyme